MRTAVIVLGDLGRSPRMQYHAVSLADAGGEVDLIGFAGTAVIPAVAGHARIRVHRLADAGFGRSAGGLRRFVAGSAARVVSHAWQLFRHLMRIPAPDTLLVQNPPAVPTLAVAWCVARLRGARLVIDWHNLSHTVVAVKLGDHHRAVAAIARSERRWALRADAHLAVSRELGDWLRRECGLPATVCYDRPVAAFAPPSPAAADALWTRLSGELRLPQQRLPIVVCPTSWTPDEDFDLLLEALERAERRLAAREPQILICLTGRGPMRDAFAERVSRRSFSALAVRLVWLEPADYPVLIGMASLGVCLHQSSSGLDLPMKLADLRGAGVPVACFDYAPVLGEVMSDGWEGVWFRDPGDLAEILVGVARGTHRAVSGAREWLAAHPPERWDAQWNASARHVLIK